MLGCGERQSCLKKATIRILRLFQLVALVSSEDTISI
jgi:hypothetical protein